ncbi:MAG TPA: glycosyltransferase [Candidatus Saccharimonadales bacterium]|nr:glycosyltransferase [Candidatus Saccharimonadales bacterium]
MASLAGLSFVLTAWRWIVGQRFPLHRPLAAAASLPGVTFLKPLKGCNAETAHCLRSWFGQRYPGAVQILCGVASADDPVCPVVKELMAEFPAVDAQLVICSQNLGTNGKVSTLRQLEPHIHHPLIVLSDADVRVTPALAAQVTPLLADPGVGLANCFYRLANPTTLAMRWEAVAINADFWSQVLQSKSLRPPDFALGAVMSFSAVYLRKIGGFAPLAEYLADDYQLGRHITQAGGRIELSTTVVDCREAPMAWPEVWAHQVRWARTIRVCQPAPFFLSLLGNASLWPLLWLLFGRSPMSVPVWVALLVFRTLTAAQQQSRLTQARAHLPYWWMAPVKDLLDVLIWAAAFLGNHIDWRGQRYRVLSDGKLLKV